MNVRIPTLAIALAALTVLAQPALAQSNVKVGGLRCEVSGGLGLIITSAKDMLCIFTSSHGYAERYYGTIRKFGLDIGVTSGGVLAWAVFAPTARQRSPPRAGGERWRATMSEPTLRSRLGRGSAPMRSSADSAARSLCSRCRSRCSPAWRSPLASHR